MGLGLSFTYLAGCARPSEFPTEQLASAEVAARRAHELGAYQDANASLHLKLADAHIAEAKGFMRGGDNERAELTLRSASSEAELAITLAKEHNRSAAAPSEQARSADSAAPSTVPGKEASRPSVVSVPAQQLFAFASSQLTPSGIRKLDEVVTAISAVPDHVVTVAAFTDSQGSRVANVDLAQRRAEAVRTYLTSKLPGDVVTAQGIGPDRPIADNATAEGRANNRRVEITIARAAPSAAAPTVAGAASAQATSSPAAAAAAPTPAAPAPTYVSASPQPSAYALIIGIEKYRDVPPPTGARGDAEKFAVLVRQTLGVPESHIQVALDDRASKSDIEKNLDWLKANVPAGARIYFYFSGHGAPDPIRGTSYLLPYDGDPRFLERTALPMGDVLRALSQTKAREVLAMTDTCFSGAGGRSVLPPGARALVRVQTAPVSASVALLSAASGAEISGPAPGTANGLFTSHVLDGLGQAKADMNGDGQVSLDELAAYVKPRVARDAKRDNREQNPTLTTGATVGAADKFIVEWGLASK